MPELTETVNNTITSSAPLESNISKGHPYTDLALIDLGTLREGCMSLDSLLKTFMVGCGRVDLFEISFKAVCGSEQETIKLGIKEAGGQMPIEFVCMKANGFIHTSNPKNYGQEITGVLTPEDTLSRMIRPQSADLPMMNLVWSLSEDVRCMLYIKFIVRGMRIHQLSFPVSNKASKAPA